MQPKNWKSFTRRIPVRAEMVEVYSAWTTSQGLESWFLRKADFRDQDIALSDLTPVQKDNTYTWFWYGYSDASKEEGTILEANGQSQLSFGFGAAGTVDVLLESLPDGQTLVSITQHEIPEDDTSRMNYYVGCTVGWTFYLANLKSVLEGGLDLRNRDENIKDVVSS
jgi:uncharacterized protein YndB with AHSA1/START domain